MQNLFRLSLIIWTVFAVTACGSAAAATQEPATAIPPTAVPPTTAAPIATDAEPCPKTDEVTATPPDDPNADPFGDGPWYVNADQTLWAGPQPAFWSASPDGNKTLWIRPTGTDLQIKGQRLDGDSAPLKADIPCCYPTSFQIVGLYFPSAGCWEVSAEAGSSQLTFVTLVE